MYTTKKAYGSHNARTAATRAADIANSIAAFQAKGEARDIEKDYGITDEKMKKMIQQNLTILNPRQARNDTHAAPTTVNTVARALLDIHSALQKVKSTQEALLIPLQLTVELLKRVADTLEELRTK